MTKVLWGYAELAAHTEVSATLLRQWKVRGRLPEPDYLLSGSPGWEPETIVSWWGARDDEGAGS